jgi:short-subunit dehydrogenase
MGKVILISGGGDGLGSAIASNLSKNHQIIIVGRTKETLNKVAQDTGCDFEVCDISNIQQVHNTIKKIEDKYKKIDVLVNNASVWIQGELDQNEPDQIQQTININITGTILFTKTVASVMQKHKEGLIININSQGGLYAKAERSVYTSAKWAMTGFTKSVQLELAKFGIRVTGLYPGKMKTGMFAKVGITKDMSDAMDPEEVAKVIAFLVESNVNVVFPEIGIKNIDN